MATNYLNKSWKFPLKAPFCVGEQISKKISTYADQTFLFSKIAIFTNCSDRKLFTIKHALLETEASFMFEIAFK